MTYGSRLIAYAEEQKMSEWLKAEPDYLGAQGTRSSIPISASATAAFRTRRRCCQRIEQQEGTEIAEFR